MLDDINFGNPSQKYIPFLEKACAYDKHIPALIKFGFPQNSSKATREELNTIVDYIQVSFTNDDAFEWFGGTVNAKHLVSYRNLDDDMDCDFGYRGKVQFVLIVNPFPIIIGSFLK